MQNQIHGFRDLGNEVFDTRTLLRNATEQAIERHIDGIRFERTEHGYKGSA